MPYLRLIGPAEATGELRHHYAAAIERAGRVFHILEAMSLRPAVLGRFVDLALEIMSGPSDLTLDERRLLALVVSAANRCEYSTGVYAQELRGAGWAPELVAAVERDYRRAELDARLVALCDFAVQVTQRPASVTAEDVESFRAHGFGDAAIHDAIQTIALLNYANRVADSIGIGPEPSP
jgi:uncharacterized peroxidase-related enzyme